MKKLVGIIVMLLVVTVESNLNSAELRTWKDVSGEYSTVAEFVSLKDGKVQLKKQNGSVISVPLERLSEADRAYAKSQAASKPANARLDYYELNEKESLAYAEENKSLLRDVKPDATGFHLGNLFDNETGRLIVDNEEVAKIRKVGSNYSHDKMSEEDERRGLLADLIGAIGEEKLAKIGLTILVKGKPKYVWPAPAKSKPAASGG